MVMRRSKIRRSGGQVIRLVVGRILRNFKLVNKFTLLRRVVKMLLSGRSNRSVRLVARLSYRKRHGHRQDRILFLSTLNAMIPLILLVVIMRLVRRRPKMVNFLKLFTVVPLLVWRRGRMIMVFRGRRLFAVRMNILFTKMRVRVLVVSWTRLHRMVVRGTRFWRGWLLMFMDRIPLRLVLLRMIVIVFGSLFQIKGRLLLVVSGLFLFLHLKLRRRRIVMSLVIIVKSGVIIRFLFRRIPLVQVLFALRCRRVNPVSRVIPKLLWKKNRRRRRVRFVLLLMLHASTPISKIRKRHNITDNTTPAGTFLRGKSISGYSSVKKSGHVPPDIDEATKE